VGIDGGCADKQLISDLMVGEPSGDQRENFFFPADDGWTSTVQEGWVEVKKDDLRVLIHYPHAKADEYNTVLLDKLKNSWNLLVAPKYSSASNLEFRPVSDWQSVEFAEASAIQVGTGKSVYVVLFRFNSSNGGGSYMEFITPDKNTFEKMFGAYQPSTSGWEKMKNMAGYNKFAVAASDLKGTWSNKFSGSLHYVDSNTGAFAACQHTPPVKNLSLVRETLIIGASAQPLGWLAT
jgi:hypothetical protein